MTQVSSWQKLEWDSHFFGFGVARIDGAPSSVTQLIETRQLARDAGIKLIYVTCAPGDMTAQTTLTNAGALLADLRRTYISDLAGTHAAPTDDEFTINLPVQPAACERRQLRSLAWQAAECSRFKIDPRMPAGAWRRMYSAWIANSLNGQLADRILTIRSASGVFDAMTTLALRGSRATIGLLAVRQGQRGRGLGRQLVNAALRDAKQVGLRELAVVTQGTNVNACRTYEACNMMAATDQYVFHLWTDE